MFGVEVLEDIMRSHEENQEFYKIPPRGKHYADKWAHEDMLEEQRQSQSSLACSSSAIYVRCILSHCYKPANFEPR